jgi:glycosyltransferase involved in cell wall biosynthesis
VKSVAVWMIAYNHELYIDNAINGFLNQKVKFPKKLFLSVDKSNDNTLQIASDYASKYPEIINLMASNHWLGYQENFIKNLEVIDDSYEYLAMCEGDDYWCDDKKLQKQIDLLEQNPNYVMVFHDGYSIDETCKFLRYFSRDRISDNRCGLFDSRKIIGSPFRIIHLSSICYKKREIDFSVLRSHFYNAPVLDTPLINLIASKGDVYYLPDKMFYQRNHSLSITGQRNFDFEYYTSVKDMLIKLKFIIPEFSGELEIAIRGRYYSYLMYRYRNTENQWDRLKLKFKLFYHRKIHHYSVRDIFYLFRNRK